MFVDIQPRDSVRIGAEGIDPYRTRGLAPGGGGGNLFLTLPGCVCPKVKDMGPFLASKE